MIAVVVALVTVAAAWMALRVSRERGLPGHARSVWWLFGAAWLTRAAAWLASGIVTAGSSSPDVLSMSVLAAAPLMCIALVRLPRPARRSYELVSAGIDAAVVAAASWMAIWQFVAAPAIARGAIDAVTLVALVADVAVVGAAAFVLSHCPRGARRVPVLLVAVSAIAMVVTDLIWISTGDAAGPAIVLPALLSALAFVGASEVKRRRLRRGYTDEHLLPQPIAWLPYTAVAVAYLVLVTTMVVSEPRDVAMPLIVTGVLATLLLARQWIAIRENARLVRERALLPNDARFRKLVQHASDVVAIVDESWTITYVSPAVYSVIGHRSSQLLGGALLDLVHPDDAGDASNRLRELMADPTRSTTCRWRMRCADGMTIDTDVTCVNLVADEHVRGIVLTIRDVSEHRSLEAQLTHRAFHDPLTGLANRALFQDRVQHALVRRRGSDLDTLGVVFLDLDHFKVANDSLGHAGGDALLKAAAERLVRGLRAFDTAARLGGDEFAVLVDDVRGQEDVTQVADRITRAFREPFVIDGREWRTSASVGVAMAVGGQTAEELLRNADLAMYLAKSRGRGQSAVFEPSMHAAAMTRLELQHDLRHALERGELTLVYQPIRSLDSQVLVGAEALLRWVHPTRGAIAPDVFVPIAEEAGLMVPIGEWVLERACHDARTWCSSAGGHPLRVSINLSGRQIPDADLFKHVERAVATSGIAPGSIVLELTERILLQHTDRSLPLLHRLKALGVRIAIDDFGTGLSSLSYLQRLPIDMLKIDRVFVDAIVTDAHAVQLARAVVGLGESMSLLTVAEGIESAEQAERLRSLGCDYGQGYGFGMPMPADALGDYAERMRMFSEV